MRARDPPEPAHFKNIASLFATGMALRMIVFCLNSAAQYLCHRVLKASLFAETEGSAELFRLILRVCLPLPRPVPQHLLLPEPIGRAPLRGEEGVGRERESRSTYDAASNIQPAFSQHSASECSIIPLPCCQASHVLGHGPGQGKPQAGLLAPPPSNLKQGDSW